MKFHIASQFKKQTNKAKNKIKPLYLSINVFATKNTSWGHYFDFSNWKWGRHSTWSSKPLDGPAAYVSKTLSVDPAPGYHATSPPAVKRPTD